ncbi:hypothetical protein [Enteractinococcus coprophilus]|uniref:hypothetical protein n=1 Tax=Enteractinococcus coprophilus TaxID=1027633 RepID=UPI0011539FFD|nr:hypothetical protein [Enteractinococcus coprophilus]
MATFGRFALAVLSTAQHLSLINWDCGAFIRTRLDRGNSRLAHQSGAHSNRADDAFFIEFGSYSAVTNSTV